MRRSIRLGDLVHHRRIRFSGQAVAFIQHLDGRHEVCIRRNSLNGADVRWYPVRDVKRRATIKL